MQSPHDRSFMSTTNVYSMFFWGIGCVVLTLFLSSCSSTDSAQLGTSQAEQNVLPLRYSIVCIIHGDGDYLYHDSRGNERNADEMALARAIRVAEKNPHAEVFIFHERPRSNFLLFFPLHDGEFYYYRNGQLLANEPYWRDQGLSRFDPQVSFYQRFHTLEQAQLVKLFLYFGHEIPEIDGKGYDASYPDGLFTMHDLADGLKRITSDSTKFDLIVLSTCFNGTPYTIATLSPYARYIIASPDNLHLSYFDLRPFERLDISLRDGGILAFARQFAQHAFDRLTKNIQTVVTVAVYDVDCVQGFLHSVDSVDRALTMLKGKTMGSVATVEHCDCADLPAYMLPMMSEGVDVFYRPARFGRSKYKQNHSGWQCWTEKEPQIVTSQTPEPTPKRSGNHDENR